MKIVIFGLSVSSSWGNGHATLWRALCAALGRRGHRVVFFEKDLPYYARHRDLKQLPGGGALMLYPSLTEVIASARTHVDEADVAMVTSYCPDGIAAAELILASRARLRVLYDLDTPVTLARLAAGQPVSYLAPAHVPEFDLVLSFTGGASLTALEQRLGARRVAPLYGCVDPDAHRPVPPEPALRSELSYLGTYAEDRQAGVETLFFEVARRLPARRFCLAGPLYPATLRWPPNVRHMPHLAPADHPAFFASSGMTLNITRRVMADSGFCPSGRLFEAAACGTLLLSDAWEGLERFFRPGLELLLVRDSDDVTHALAAPRADRERIARAARERTLSEHTAARRVVELEVLLEEAARPCNVAPRDAGGSA